jgi:hypothetical protein
MRAILFGGLAVVGLGKLIYDWLQHNPVPEAERPPWSVEHLEEP